MASVYGQAADAAADGDWTLYAGGEVRAVDAAVVAGARLDVTAVRARCAEAVEVEQAYEDFAAAGVEIGTRAAGTGHDIIRVEGAPVV